MIDSLEKLVQDVRTHMVLDDETSRTRKLFASGMPKIVKKLAEEAVEVGIEALENDREEVIAESADLLYHLAVLWVASGVTPQDITAELRRREALYGIAEKRRKTDRPEAGENGTKPANPAG
jgi:phosphoribosyl-ATP pyrophosphohydrolase